MLENCVPVPRRRMQHHLPSSSRCAARPALASIRVHTCAAHKLWQYAACYAAYNDILLNKEWCCASVPTQDERTRPSCFFSQEQLYQGHGWTLEIMMNCTQSKKYHNYSSWILSTSLFALSTINCVIVPNDRSIMFNIFSTVLNCTYYIF